MPWSQSIIKDEQSHRRYSSSLLQEQSNDIGLDPLLARPESDRNVHPHLALGDDDVLRDIEQRAAALDQSSSAIQPKDDNLLEELKRFESPQEESGVYRESPLERFLALGELDGPTYYTRPALERLGLQAGDLEGMQERQDLTQRNLDVVSTNQEQALGVGSLAGQSIQAEMGL